MGKEIYTDLPLADWTFKHNKGDSYEIEDIKFGCQLLNTRNLDAIRINAGCIQDQLTQIAQELHEINVRKDRNIWIRLRRYFKPRRKFRPFKKLFKRK